MEIIAMESAAYQDLKERLERLEQYIERTSLLLKDIDDELEMTTSELMSTLNISESTLYRWRKKPLVRYRYTESGDVRFSYKSILISLKCGRLRVSGMTVEDCLSKMNRYKDNLIINNCLNSK